MVAYGTHTSAFSTPPQRKTQSPLLHPQHKDTLPTVPQVSNRPLVLPMEGASFLALQNVGVRQGPPQHSRPQNTPPWSIRRRTRLAAIPGVHGRLPGSPARPTRPRPAPGAPPRGRLRRATRTCQAPAAPRPGQRPFGQSAGPTGRGRPPCAPRPRPPCYRLLSRTIR